MLGQWICDVHNLKPTAILKPLLCLISRYHFIKAGGRNLNGSRYKSTSCIETNKRY